MDAYKPSIWHSTERLNTVTIIIAAKNAQCWIGDCITSIQQQILPPGVSMQVIIGIDACPDTLRVTSLIDWPDLVVLYFPQWCGPYSIFNTCATYAKGSLIFRFDADDVMLPNYVAAQLDMFAQPEISIVHTWSIHTDADLIPKEALLSDGRFTPPDGRLRRGSAGQFAMCRAVWEHLGGFQPWFCFGDAEFLTRAKMAGFIVAEVPDFLYLRRIHPASLTRATATDYNSMLRMSYQEQVRTMKDLWTTSKVIPPKLCPDISLHEFVRGQP